MWAMAERAKKDAEEHFRYWDRNNVIRAVREAGGQHSGQASQSSHSASEVTGTPPTTGADSGGTPGAQGHTPSGG